MYITISPQKRGSQFSSSVKDFVEYLEKENQEGHPETKEFFFNQTNENILPQQVIEEIDGNTAKLKHSEPRFYSITVNPSQAELRHLKNDPAQLKLYIRELMKDYAGCFNRDIHGRKVVPSDIKYFAKVEFSRTFKGHDREIKENAPFSKKITKLQNDIRKVNRGEISGSKKAIEKEIIQLQRQAPHHLNMRMVEQGMLKPGIQTHVHIIVSRKDQSNTVSLSPGSKYKSSEVVFNGKTVKRGFDRDRFFQQAEIRFDNQFKYPRNFVEKYSSRKSFLNSPKTYYANILKLPSSERKLAMQLINSTGVQLPILPNSKLRIALKQLEKAIMVGLKSSSIGY